MDESIIGAQIGALPGPELPDAPEAPGAGTSRLKVDFLAPSLTDPLESYAEDAFNVSGTKGGARFARGLHGMFGGLKLAIVDLLVGGFEMVWEGLKAKGPKGPPPAPPMP